MYFFFYYPIGVETDDEGLPWITGLLTLLMIGIILYFKFFPMQAIYQWRWWIYFPQEGLTPGMILSVLNHGNWLHLGGNLLYLWVFGPSLERAMGPLRFGISFLFLGLVGNLSQAIVSRYIFPDLADFGIVGASGAVSGLLGLFLLRFPYGRIKSIWVIFSPLHGLVKSGLIRIPSALAIFFWIGFQILSVSAKLIGSGQDMTAYGAHLGGLACGILLAAAYQMHTEGQYYRWRHNARDRFGRGDWMGAYQAIQPLLRSQDPEDLTLAARATRLVGHEQRAIKLYRRAIANTLSKNDEPGAAAVYAEALRFYPLLSFDESRQHRLILAMDRLGLESAALAAIHVFRSIHPESSQLGVLLLRAARLEEKNDPLTAQKLYLEHLHRYPGSPYETLAKEALRQLNPDPIRHAP